MDENMAILLAKARGLPPPLVAARGRRKRRRAPLLPEGRPLLS